MLRTEIRLALIAVQLTLVGWVVVLLRNVTPKAAAPGFGAGALATELVKMNELEDRIQAMSSRHVVNGLDNSRPVVKSYEDLLGRIASLEARIRGKTFGVVSASDLASEVPPEMVFVSVGYYRAVLLDRRAELEARLEALDMLRALPDGLARSPEVVAEAIFMLRRLQDEQARRRVLSGMRGLGGSDDASDLRSACMEAAVFDGSRHVRQAAVQNLSRMSGDPEIRSLLQRIAHEDPSLEVRSWARRAMELGGGS